jgi:hypothetical protein
VGFVKPAVKLMVMGVLAVRPPLILATLTVCTGLPLPSVLAVPTLEVGLEIVGTLFDAKVQVSPIKGLFAQKSITTSAVLETVVAGVNFNE